MDAKQIKGRLSDWSWFYKCRSRNTTSKFQYMKQRQFPFLSTMYKFLTKILALDFASIDI